MNLLVVEMRRGLHRKVLRVMIVLALLACAFAGVVGFLSSSGKTIAELQASKGTHPALLTDWWTPGQDGAVLTAAIFLILGGFFTGAAIAGAEWRAGTVTTVLTWEPRRVRMNLTRTAAGAILAFALSFGLQVAFLAAFLPAVLAHGTTDGASSGWWISLALALARTSLITAIVSVLGVALATLGRNTAFALGFVFAWMAVIEGVIRGIRPGWAQFLWAENIVTVEEWAQMRNVEFTRGPVLALATLLLYTAVIIAAATITFRRRDVAGTS
jgi:hypothetical protein